jgi:transcription initiation factor TFIIIB Brf1 subunit/transcription initiation factor TFIIB
MAECIQCPICGATINLEIDIYRNDQNDIVCKKCDNVIKL